MGLRLLLKGSQQRVQIGSWSVLAVSPPQSIEQRLHRSPFVDKTADVALWLGQANCFRKSVECLLLFLELLMGQGLQETNLHDVSPALACGGSLKRGFQSL